jgi:hypothetical protein
MWIRPRRYRPLQKFVVRRAQTNRLSIRQPHQINTRNSGNPLFPVLLSLGLSGACCFEPVPYENAEPPPKTHHDRQKCVSRLRTVPLQPLA